MRTPATDSHQPARRLTPRNLHLLRPLEQPVSTPNTDRPEPPAARGRVLIHASCSVHQGARGFTNLVIRKLNWEVELDPHVDGSCKLALAEDAACTLRDALIEWLG